MSKEPWKTAEAVATNNENPVLEGVTRFRPDVVSWLDGKRKPLAACQLSARGVIIRTAGDLKDLHAYVYLPGMIMQVAKWGNSLAVRLPASVVDALGLKEGDGH